jgi:hypothetical protein
MSKNPQGNSPNQKMNGMAIFNGGHFEKKHDELATSDLKYTQGEMDNPKHLKESVDKLAGYVKSHRAAH